MYVPRNPSLRIQRTPLKISVKDESMRLMLSSFLGKSGIDLPIFLPCPWLDTTIVFYFLCYSSSHAKNGKATPYTLSCLWAETVQATPLGKLLLHCYWLPLRVCADLGHFSSVYLNSGLVRAIHCFILASHFPVLALLCNRNGDLKLLLA